ncbi:MAG: hypothetical protein IJT06_03945 [Selenomonadaceae bacterium]|nr:hypothetical protein [Selenomonadaceae bacterium]
MKNFEKKYSDIPVYTVIIRPAPPPKPPKELFPVPQEHAHEEIIIVKEVAESALKLENAKKISLGGDLSGAILFDGSEDVTLKAAVKVADRAIKDGNGKDISKTYARQSDLDKYVLKSEIQRKINYLERIIYATKMAVNESLREQDLEVATDDDLENLFGEDSDTSTSTTTSDTSSSNSGLATEDDIDALFGGN